MPFLSPPSHSFGMGSRTRTYVELALAGFGDRCNRHYAIPIGVNGETRTLDNRGHNAALYQLSYAHHIGTPNWTRTSDLLLRR